MITIPAIVLFLLSIAHLKVNGCFLIHKKLCSYNFYELKSGVCRGESLRRPKEGSACKAGAEGNPRFPIGVPSNFLNRFHFITANA